MRISIVPDVNVALKVFAENTPPVFTENKLTGENVTLFIRVTFPLLPTKIFPPVQVPEPETAVVESKLKFGVAIVPVFDNAVP